MLLCEFDADLRCIECGAPRFNARQLCGTWRPGLGDRVAAGLEAVGITKERAQAVASAAGIKDCGCAERQEWMNRAGGLVGIGAAPKSAEEPTSG